MRAWGHARREARATQSEYTTKATGGEFVDPAVDGVTEAVAWYDFDDPRVCIVCRAQRKLRTGYLPTLGPCRVCATPKCQKAYSRMADTMRKFSNRGVCP